MKGKHSGLLYSYSFILFLLSPLLFIEAQKVVLTTPITNQPSVVLVNDSTVYYTISTKVYITNHTPDSNGNWQSKTINGNLPESPSSGTIYQNFALFAGLSKLALVKYDGTVSSTALPAGSSSPLLCTTSISGTTVSYVVYTGAGNASFIATVGISTANSTYSAVFSSPTQISAETTVALACGTDKAVAGSKSGHYVAVTWQSLQTTTLSGGGTAPAQGAYVLPGTFLFSSASASKSLFNPVASQSINNVVTSGTGVTALTSNPQYKKFFVASNDGSIAYSDCLGCSTSCPFASLNSITLKPGITSLVSDNDLPYLYAVNATSITLVDPVAVSNARLQSPSPSVNITAGTQTTFTFQLFDDLNTLRIFVTPADSPRVTLSLSNGNNITANPAFSYSTKLYSFSYKPTLAGSLGVILGSSLASTFSVVPSNPKSVSFSPPTPIKSGDTGSLVINVLDQFNNIVPQTISGTQATSDLTFSSNPTLSYQVSISAQGAKVTINETKAGTYTFTIFLRGAQQQQISVPIIPGDLVLTTDSLLSWAPNATAGSSFSFSLRAADKNNNLILSSPENQLIINFSPLARMGGSCKSNSGTISCTYTSAFSAIYNVTIQTSNTPPTSLPQQTVTVQPAAASSMSITPSIIAQGNVSTQYTAKLVATDTYGNVIGQNDVAPGQSTNFLVQADNSDLQITLHSDATGSTLLYSSTVASKFRLSIFFCHRTCLSQPTQQSTVAFLPGPISTTKSTVTYPTGSLQVATQYLVTVALFDDYSNPITDFSGLVPQFSSSNIVATTHATDVFTIDFYSTVSGPYTLILSAAGGNLQGSPYRFVLNPGPTAKYVTVPLPDGPYYAGTTYSLFVTAYDQFTNVVYQNLTSAYTTPDFSFSVASNASEVDLSVSVLSNGSVQASFYTTKSQQFSINAYFQRTILPIYTSIISVLPGPVDCNRSVVAPASLPDVVVGNTSSLSINSFDQFGNPTNTNLDTVYSFAFSPAQFNYSTAQSGGALQLSYSTHVAREYTLSVNCSSVNSTFWNLPFTAFPLPASVATISPMPSPVKVGQLYTLVATARDIYDNLVSQVQQTDASTTDFRIDFLPPMGYLQLNPLANKSVEIAFNTTVAGSYNLTIYFDQSVFLSQVFEVLPGQVICANSVIEPSLNGSLNVGSISTSRISSYDVYHNLASTNPADSYKISFSSPQINYTTKDPGTGVVELDYITNVTGIYTALITCNSVDTKTWFYNLSADPGYPSLEMSSLHPGSFPDFTVDDNFTFALSANDIYGNPIRQEQTDPTALSSNSFQVSFYGNQNIQHSLSVVDGNLQITVWSRVAATYNIAINLMVGPNRWFPFFSGNFVIYPGAPTSATSFVSYPPTEGQVGTPYIIHINAFDKYKNAIYNSPAKNYALTFIPNNVSISTTDQHNGSFYYTFSTKVSANYSISFTTAGEDLALSPFAMSIFPGLPTKVSSTVPPPSNGTAGANYSLTIIARDEFGNLVPQYLPATLPSANASLSLRDDSMRDTPPRGSTLSDSSLRGLSLRNYGSMRDISPRDDSVPQDLTSPLNSTDFSISFSPSINFSLAVTSSGYLTVTYWTTVAAPNYTMVVMLENDLAYQYTFSISPATVAPERCLGIGSALSGGVVSYNSSFLIISRDEYDNEISESTGDFNVTITGPAGNLAVLLTDLQNGTYQAIFTPVVAGAYTITITLAGTNILGSPYASSFISVPASLSPLYGPVEGNTSVSISGTGFYDSQHISCKFLNVTVPGIFVENSIVCMTPVYTPDSSSQDLFPVPVSVSIDGVHFSDKPLPFYYYRSPIINSVRPQSSPFTGGTQVRILGEGFQNLTGLACRFGPSIIVPAQFNSSELLICVTPEVVSPSKTRAALASNTSELNLEISLNGQQFTNNQSQFIFYNPPSLVSITPPLGPVNGNTTLTMQLDYLPSCGDFSVEWAKTPLDVTCLQNLSQVKFTIPAQSFENVALLINASYSVDGQHWMTAPISFTYTPPISTYTACPPSVGNNVASQVAVFGANFLATRWTYCGVVLQNETYFLNATVVSDQLVSCFVPPGLPSGETSLQVSNNGQNFEGGINFTVSGAASQIKIIVPNGNFSESDSHSIVYLDPAPEVALQDYFGVGIRKTSTGTLPVITISTRLADSNNSWDPVSSELGGSAQLDPETGNIRFSSLVILGDRGSVYQLRFEYRGDGLSIDQISPVNVTIHPCSDTEVLVGPPGNEDCECNVGYYKGQSDTECLPCMEGYYMDTTGQQQCIPCPPFTSTFAPGATNASQCVCANDRFTQPGSDEKCGPCPVGADCPGGNVIKSLDGYWQAPNTYIFYPCPESSACTNQTCAPGSFGPVCGACSDGYALVGSKCTKCPKNHGLVWFLFVITGSAILVGIAILIYNNVNGERSERTIVLKIMINYLQTLSFIGGFSYIWTYSKAVLGIFQFSDASNISVGIFTVYCAVQWNQYEKFLLYILVPVVGGLLVLTLFFLKFLKESAGNRRNISLFIQSPHWRKTKSTILVFLFLIHPTLTEQIFKIFNCERYGSAHYLAADLSISCDDGTYRRWQAAAIAMIVIYVVGIPVSGFAFVMKYRNHLGDPSVKQRFRFLYEGYAKHAYFWEFVIIIRKIILVAIVVFLKTENFRAVYSGIWLLLIALLVHTWVSPYQSPSLEALESATLCVLLTTLLFGLFSFADNFTHSEKTFATVVVLGINILMAAILLVILIYLYYNMISKHTKFNAMLARIKRFLDSKRDRQGDFDNGQVELEDYSDNSFYNVGLAGEVTADKLRSARSKHNLDMEKSSPVNLSVIQVASPRSGKTEQTTDGLDDL